MADKNEDASEVDAQPEVEPVEEPRRLNVVRCPVCSHSVLGDSACPFCGFRG